MAKRLYIANAPKVAQVDRLTLPKAQYLQRHIAEGSALIATIGAKEIIAYAPYREESLTNPIGPWTEIDDALLTKAILTDLSQKWNTTNIPEFREVKCSAPLQDDNANWYLDFTSKVEGVPFFLDISAPHPVVDVDTIRNGAVGTNGVFDFWISSVATGGTFRIQWNLGAGVETSGIINYPPTAASIRAAIMAGMPSMGDDEIQVSGDGTASVPWRLSVAGALANTVLAAPMILVGDITGGGSVYSATINEGGQGLVIDTFNGGGQQLSSHTGDNGYTWEVSGNALPFISAGQLHIDDNSELSNGHSSATMLNSYDQSPNGVIEISSHDIALYTGRSTYGVTTFQLYSRYVDNDNHIVAEFKFDANANGTRPTPPTAQDVQWYTGTIEMTLKTVSAGISTVLGAVTINRNIYSNALNSNGSGGLVHVRTVLYNYTFKFSLSTIGNAHILTLLDKITTITTTVSGTAAYNSGSSTFGMGQTMPHSYNWSQFDNFAIYDGTDFDERHKFWTDGTGGVFELTNPDGPVTVGNVPATGSHTEIQLKLDVIYGVGNTTIVSGDGTALNPWVVRYIGTLSGDNVPLITGTGEGLTGFASASVLTIGTGSPSVTEQWSMAIVGATGGFIAPTFRGEPPVTNFAYNGNAAALAASLNSIALIDDDGLATTLGATVTGLGTHVSPFIINIGTEFLGIDVRQLVALPHNLTGALYPVFTFTTVTDSEGPWHWNHPLNWLNADTGAYGVPVNNDSLHFESGDQFHCPKYDLDQSALTVTAIYATGGFTNQAICGLPRWNILGYWEYRRTELDIRMTAPNIACIGARGGGGSPLFKFTTGNTKVLLIVHATSSPLQGESSAVQFHGTHAENEVELLNGFVGIAPYPGQTANVVKLTQRGGIITVGNGASLADIYRTAGTCTMDRVTVSGIQEVYV